MNISIETLTIFVFLIPGFVSSLIINTIVVRKGKDNLSKIIEALVFSFFIYVVISMVNGENPVLIRSEQINNKTTYAISYNSNVVIPVAVLSIFLPLLLGFLSTTDIHMKLLRKLKITNKTARETVWLDVFTEQKRYVIVNLADGRRVFGWPMYYSNNPEEGCLYLYDAAWINDEGKYIDLKIHGLFLVKKDNIESIEFTLIDKSSATEDKGGNINEQ